ncbi:MAG: hypothetical protein LPK26_04710 [Bacillaceae bacterium]|mgnify:CR=1 FL=1|nr:hypothetical protein [Bacillaceae bacterium]
MIELQKANNYFESRLHNEKWIEASDTTRENAITTAENMIKGSFSLRENAEETTAYFHSVCEQAFHLINFSKERFQLQQEGVHRYNVDDIQIEMTNGLFPPIVMGFLKPIIHKKAGRIV